MGAQITCFCGEQYSVDSGTPSEPNCARCGRPLIVTSLNKTESDQFSIQELDPEINEDFPAVEPARLRMPSGKLKRMYCPKCCAWELGQPRPVMHTLHLMLSVFLCLPWAIVWFLLTWFPARMCVQCGGRTYIGSGRAAQLATLPNLLVGGAAISTATIMLFFVIPDFRANQHFERGYQLLQSRQFEPALAEFSTVIELQPNNYTALYNRGLIHQELGNLQTALSDLDAAILVAPGDVDSLRLRGELHLALNNLTAATADLDRAIEIDPGNAEMYFQRGYLRQEAQNWQKAIADYDHAVVLDPRHTEARYRRGYCHWSEHELDLAVADFDAVIAIDPKHSDAFHHRGHAREDLRDFERALSDYTEAIKLSGDDPRNYACRASCLFNLGEFTKSVDDFSQAISKNDQEADYFYWRGQAFVRLRNLENAHDDFKKACDLTHGANEQYSEALRAVEEELNDNQNQPENAPGSVDDVATRLFSLQVIRRISKSSVQTDKTAPV